MRLARRNRENLFPVLGEGFVDWKSFIAAVEEIGYEGVMSVEFESFKYLKMYYTTTWKKRQIFHTEA